MKKKLVQSIFALSLFSLTTLSQAQNNSPALHADRATPTPRPGPVVPEAPRSTRPYSIRIGNSGVFSSSGVGNIVSEVLSRFNSIGIEDLIANQRTSGISEKTYIAAFSANGAGIFEHDISGEPLTSYGDIGKNSGAQFVPFTVSFSPAGPYYISVGAAALRNMNAIQNTSAAWKHETENDRKQVSGFWKIMDNVDLFVFKFDQGYSYSKLNSMEFQYATFDAKIDLLNSSVGARYLAVKVGAGMGAATETLYTPDGNKNVLGADLGGDVSRDAQTRAGWAPFVYNPPALNIKYGLEYNNESHKGFKINLKTLINERWFGGPSIDPIRYNEYAATGGTGADNRVVNFSHNSTYVDSDLELSQLVSKHAKPIYIGGGVTTHVPLSDVIQSDGTLGTVNLAPYNNQLVKIKLFVHF